jgi:DNA-binding NarL/FixJ family response regulator
MCYHPAAGNERLIVSASVKLLVIAEQANYRDLYRNLFPVGGDIELVELAHGTGAGLAGSLARHRPDVVMASLVNLDATDAETLVDLRRDFPAIGIIVTFLFYRPEDLRELRPLVVGADGGVAVLLNSSVNPATEMAALVHAVDSGQVYIDPALTTMLLSDHAPEPVALEGLPISGASTPKPAATTEKPGDSLEVAHLIDGLRDLNYDAREAAARALGEQRDLRALPGLIEALRDGHCFVRVSAAKALGNIGNARAVAPLAVSLKDDDWEVRVTAAWALGEIGVKRTEEPLIDAMADPNMLVKRQAAESLKKLRRRDA